MEPEYDKDAVEAAERAVFDEQESNERATAGTNTRDDDQADEMADKAEEADEEADRDD